MGICYFYSMVGYIYLVTDTTNGMKYVGQHHYDREELDPNYHGSGKIISKIYKKRPHTIKEEYLKTCYSDSEMNDAEKHYIKLYKTLYPNGYNLTEGGDGGQIPCEEIRKKISMKLKGRPSPNKGRHHSGASKKKISDANKGKQLSEETRRKISNAQKGEKNHNYGKNPSEETRRKISEANKGRPMSEEQKKKLREANKGKQHSEETREKLREANINGKYSKIVLQFTLDGEFVREWPSTAECVRNGFKHVCDCCNGKRKSAYGFKWEYKEVS